MRNLEIMLRKQSPRQYRTTGPRSPVREPEVRSPWSLVLLLIVLLSCRSAPMVTDTFLEETVPLEPGAFAYFFADAFGARPILDELDIESMNNRQFRQILDSTQSVIAAVYTRQDEGLTKSRFQLAAWGDYPAFRARMALGLSRGWKKQSSAGNDPPYWFSQGNGLSVLLERQRAFITTAWDSSPKHPVTVRRTTAIPEGFGDFRRGKVFAGWLDDPGPYVSGQLQGRMNIPITIPVDTLFLGLIPIDEQLHTADEQMYTANVRFHFNEVSHALFLMGSLSGIRRNMPLEPESDNFALLAALLLTNPPVRNVRTITLTSNAMSSNEIALLFSLFSL